MVEKLTATEPKADRSLFGRRVGRFVIQELIGKGGCGAVYRCEQPVLERDVVIKVLHEERQANDGALDRFLREAKLASRLDHPYAAHVYDFGVDPEDQLMWLAMELVRGVTLGQWLHEHGAMPFEQFVPFFDRVCEVVQAAHDQQIIHRDLKPSNIMLIERGDQMFPKLLDFGIAKADRDSDLLRPASWPEGALHETLELEDSAEVHERPLTRSAPEPRRWYLTPPGFHMGTSAYMSPEQWTNARDVGPASDIYSLGVVAYESLTGRKPFAAKDAHGYYHHHLATAVPPLGERFSATLDGLIQRALAKRAEDRFGTALEFASALRAELRAQPREQIRAAAQQWQARGRPRNLLLKGSHLRAIQLPAAQVLSETEESFLRASRSRVARNRRGLAALGIIAALSGFEYHSMLRTDAARVTQGEMEQGRAALLHGELKDAQAHLGEAYKRGDHSSGTEFMFARAMQPRLAEQAVFPATFGRMWSTAWSPDGRRIATGDDRAVQVWDADTREKLLTLPHGDIVYWIAYSADGARILTTCGDGAVRIWDAVTGLLVRELRAGRQGWRYTVAAISGDRVAAMDLTGTAAHVWNTRTGEQLATLTGDGTELASIAWTSDGRWLAASGGDDVRVFDAGTWTEVLRIVGPQVDCLHFDPTGARLAVGTKTGDASIWDIPSRARVRHLREVGDPVDHIAFSPGGDLVAVASRDGSVQVWHDGKRQSSITTRGRIYSLEFDLQGTSMLATGGDGIVVADPWSGTALAMLEGPSSLITGAHFDPISRRIAGASWDGTARVWNAAPTYLHGTIREETPLSFRPYDSPVTLTSRDSRLAIILPPIDGSPELWSLAPSRHFIARLDGHIGRVWSARFIDGEDAAITAGADGTARLWDTRTGALVQTFRSTGASASRYLADAALRASLAVAGGGDGALRFWDRDTGKQIWMLQASRSAITGVDFAGDDIVSHDADGHVARWLLPSPEAVIRDTMRSRAPEAP